MSSEGVSVKALQELYSVKVLFETGGLNVEGPPLGVATVEEKLLAIIREYQVHDVTLEVEVNSELSRLIETNKERILSKTGLQELIPFEASVRMTGSRSALESGQEYLRDMQEQLNREITITITEDIDLLLPLVQGDIWSEIVTKCEGPSNPDLQRQIISIGKDARQITLRGDPNLVESIRQELERQLEVVIGVHIPHDFHADLLNEHNIDRIQLESRTLIYFPGMTTDYNSLPEPENLVDLQVQRVVLQDTVKIYGNYQRCTVAQKLLETLVEKESRLRIKLSFRAIYENAVHNLIMETLNDMGIRVISSEPSLPTPSITLIPYIPSLQSGEYSWNLTPRFNLGSTDECTWQLRARSENTLRQAHMLVDKAVKKVSAAKWLGQLTFPADPGFSKIIGSKNEMLAYLESETNTKITVPDAEAGTTVEIIGWCSWESRRHASDRINYWSSAGLKKDVKGAKSKILRMLDADWMTIAHMHPYG
ncbi:hypothetical protein K439DRAFT_830814 [Ramaria rubella]|nr:hypothetical protein K439DRAFT_830814 [Ramaria rubella]